jgi:hypothetical protein
VPSDPSDKATKTELRLWEKKVDDSAKREAYLEENIRTLYSLVWGQCTKVVRVKIEALDTYFDTTMSSEGTRATEGNQGYRF